MKRFSIKGACLSLSVVATAGVIATGAASSAAVPPLYDNCKAFNAKYPHGVGRAKAVDRTKSKTNPPVTTFARNTRLFNLAMKWNDDLDRDGDGVACEKR